jgi:cold shock CspA family protein
VSEKDLVTLRRLADHELQILGEKVAIFHQALSLPPHLRKVVGLAGIAFRDGETWIVSILAFPPGRRKWDRRAHQAHQLVWSTHLRMAEVPSRIGRQRAQSNLAGGCRSARCHPGRSPRRSAGRASQPREAVSSRSRVRHPGRSRAASPGADRPGSRRRELPRTEPLAVPFVELADGSGDAFLRASVVERNGGSSVLPGATLEVRAGPGPKGPQVTEILSVDTSTASQEQPRRERPERAAYQPVGRSMPPI